MSSVRNAYSSDTAAEKSGRCPVVHSELPGQKTSRGIPASPAPLMRDEQGVWQVAGFEEARAILRSSATRQAGFNAEQIMSIPGTTNRPILYLEGKAHQQQRKQTARFFAPKTVSSSYRQFMEELADQLIDELKRKKRVDLSELSLTLAVQVAAQVVGNTNSRLPGMGKRLNSFFEQREPAPQWLERYLKWKPVAILYQLYRQRNILLFYWLDVMPAIKARRKQPREDVISHLLGLNYNSGEILTECLTYAAAGMVTTREFISVAVWHFLEHPGLRARYLAAPEEERLEMLHETLRLEPIVGNLQRRATEDITLESEGKQVIIRAGELIDIHIHEANMDTTVVGEEPLVLCPGRPLNGERVTSMLMSFGDGHHRCPGAYLSMQETDVFLYKLLKLDSLHIERPPTINWNELTTGYEVRKFMLAL